MSIVLELEATKKALAESQALLAEVTAKSADEIKTLRADSEKAVQELTAKLDAAGKQIEALEIGAKEAVEKISDLSAAVAAKEATIKDVESKLQKAEHKLANPAFADASMPGATTAPKDGTVEDSNASGTPTWDEFNKITEPAKRTEFWNLNEAKLRAEMARAEKKA